MNTQQINSILTRNSVTKGKFLGTFPSCMTIQTKKRIYGIITNTDSHDKRGVHWCAWWNDNGHLIFFDSFGRSPLDINFPPSFSEFVGEFKQCTYVGAPVQMYDTTVCGHFCIHFIYAMSYGVSVNDFVSCYANLDENERIVTNIVDIIIINS